MAKIYLSSGHQGKGTGAAGLIDEGAETIVFTDLVLNNMTDIKDVQRSRKGISLESKIKAANNHCKTSVDMDIEFHFNASSGDKANGCEVVISDTAGVLSRQRAAEMQSILVSVLGLKDRGVKTSSQSARGKLGFVDKTKAPAMIVEICFITNKKDVEVYQKKKNELATKIAEWLGKL